MIKRWRGFGELFYSSSNGRRYLTERILLLASGSLSLIISNE